MWGVWRGRGGARGGAEAGPGFAVHTVCSAQKGDLHAGSIAVDHLLINAAGLPDGAAVVAAAHF